MSLEFNYKIQEKYIHVRLKADNNFETSKKLWNEIYDLCKKNNLNKILIISNSEPLNIMPAFEHHKLIKDIGFTFDYIVAWVEKNPNTIEVDKFIENVLVNRSIINAKLFSEESEAISWLLKSESEL